MSEPYESTNGVTQSIIQMFSACRQRSKFYLDGWRPITTGESRYLYFGSMFHDVLDLCYKSMDIRPMTVFQKWRTAHEAELVKQSFDQNRVDEMVFEIDKLEVLFQRYVAFYPKSFDTKTHIDSEVIFDVTGHGARLRGKIDRLFRVNDRIWLEETKTKSRIDDMMIESQLEFDFQSLFYAKCIGIKTGINIEGVSYNVIRNPQLRIKKTETTEQFCRRLNADIISRPEFYFKRFPCAFSGPSRERFSRNLTAKLKEFEFWRHNLNTTTYRNESACLYPYRCQYIDACSSGDLLNYERTGVLFEELHDGNTTKDSNTKGIDNWTHNSGGVPV